MHVLKSCSSHPAQQAKAEVAEEARRKAEAAAAEAAQMENTCASCGLQYGDDVVKDALWVACDHCNRWFHAVCEGLGSEQAQDLEQQEHYICR